MEYLAVVLQQNQQHTVIKPDPRPYEPLHSQPQVQVPDGGAGWAFLIAAVATVAVAVVKRYLSHNKSASRA